MNGAELMGTTDLWLKQHETGERAFAHDLAGYFAGQAGQIVDALSDFESPTTEAVAQVFDEEDEHQAFMQIALPHVFQLVQVGALTETDRVSGEKALRMCRKASGTIILDAQTEFDFATELPQGLTNAIESFLRELSEQPYWRSIQAATADILTKIIQKGLEEGFSTPRLAKEIRTSLGGDNAKIRAKAIARTETTGAMNAGHLVAMEDLATDGLVSGKTWLAILDDDVRSTHEALNETTVDANEDFDVGSSKAPYPGHHGLPARERINCRCTIVSEFGE